MKSAIKKNGFSLTEVLMAVGILSIGMMLIATMFPVAIYLTSVASERTMAAIVADEAFAKIQLYGFENPKPKDANDANFFSKTYDFEQAHNDPCLGDVPCSPGSYDLFPDINRIDPNEFSYPSVDPATKTSQYYWSALCKKWNLDPNDTLYLVTVFVARKTNPGLTYYWRDPYRCYDPNFSDRPRIVDIDVNDSPSGPDKLKISEPNKAKYINPPTTIFDANAGQFYRVADKIGLGNIDANIVILDRNWDANGQQRPVWLVPPPQTGGRNAGIEVYGPRIIKF